MNVLLLANYEELVEIKTVGKDCNRTMCHSHTIYNASRFSNQSIKSSELIYLYASITNIRSLSVRNWPIDQEEGEGERKKEEGGELREEGGW